MLAIVLFGLLLLLIRHYMRLRLRIRRISNDPLSVFDEFDRNRDCLIHTEKMAHIGALSAGLVHEINTPLGSAICMNATRQSAQEKFFAALRAKDPDLLEDPELQKLQGILIEGDGILSLGLERISALVGQLQKMGREEKPEPVAVDVHQALDGSLLLLTNALKNRVEVVRDYGSLPEILGYPTALDQVFLNLLVNASRAIQGEGRITVATGVADGCLDVRITDTGVGIPPTELDSIFDFGFTTHAESGGTGLGLPISRRIIEKHHGSLVVESTSGAGTTFRVRLPLDLQEILDGRAESRCGGRA